MASSTSGRAKPGWRQRLTPGRVVTAVLAILALVFVFQNTDETQIHLIVSEVSMPLWLALLGVGLIGVLVGWMVRGRRRYEPR
ncbi:hypothetical protein SRB5_26790 [Streptomyces sp. RB5]|uniref:Lipopolysaccharide assembly protein A domain-containing protein n=1 Tax=Streptomyces smaragdinus TaxID=2585196 RepID=A0A7K0CIH9_9ACTN|nr:LapA family protein [Streptomyces smaragdinus]MQY12544.1 hypothetical protein [Streptomyces smaragdinus]